MSSNQINLSLVPPNLREQALEAWAERDIPGVLITIDNQSCLHFVRDNVLPLMAAGLFEMALLEAYIDCRANWSSISDGLIRFLFNQADRKRLLSAGSRLPGDGPFIVYRGVAGVGARRRVRGISWTTDYDRAVWFARRLKLPRPAVFKASVPIENIYAYYTGRQEQEFLCDITNDINLERV